MSATQVFRVAVFGHPHTRHWLLAEAFAASRKRAHGYEPATDAASQAPHMCVVDPSEEGALAHWLACDPKGLLPAVFFGRVHQRAKNAVIVVRPYTSGRIVDALDQLARRAGVALAA